MKISDQVFFMIPWELFPICKLKNMAFIISVDAKELMLNTEGKGKSSN